MLSTSQLDQFEKVGCLVIRDFLQANQVKELNEEIKHLYTRVDIKNHPLTKFTTEANGEQIGNKYFLESSDKIHCFFEPDAFDKNGNLTKPIDKAINKIGHGLHILDDKFQKITINDTISGICHQLGFHDPRALQSMVITKQPEIGNAVPPHTDSEFLYTDPITCVGFWFALEDCTVKNGCLEFIPGSHKTYPVMKRMVRDTKFNSGTKFVRLSKPSEDWQPSPEEACLEESMNDPSKYTTLEIPAGSLVLINGNLVHKSERNSSSKSRNAYVFHVIEGEVKYDELNWLQIPYNNPSGSKYFSKVYIHSL